MFKNVECVSFGENVAGEAVEKYILKGAGGLTAEILNYGGTIQSLIFDGKDLVLGYDTISEYEKSGGYLGATIGRYGNRIKDGKFTLNGVEYNLGRNERGITTLHGGNVGFDKVIFNAEVIPDDIPTVKMSYKSRDGEEGFPGNLDFSITFSVTDENELKLTYSAICDEDTIFNPTNHSYFNLNGYDGGDILDTIMQINAEYITPMDEKLIPTGGFFPVAGTAFDFRKPKLIGKDIDNKDGESGAQIAFGGGYDINYAVVSGASEAVRKTRSVASCYSEKSGISMECLSDLPGVQFYSGNATESKYGKGGIPIYKRQGFCLETQFFPDSPNKTNFPTCILKKGENFFSETIYKFVKNIQL